MRPRFIASVLGALILPSLAAGQIVNGDFESGGSGWAVSVPAGWTITFEPSGGNPGGYARIESAPGGPRAQACIRQTFECGVVNPDPFAVCSIPFDYRADLGLVEGQATLQVYVNGGLFTTAALGPSAFDWQHPELGA